MGTTAVVAELLVGGLQTLTWIMFIAMTVLGPSVVSPLVTSPSAGGVLALAAAYALGVVFDRVWDFLLDISGVHDRIRTAAKAAVASSRSEAQDEMDRLRRRVFGVDAKAAVDFVNYNRSRMRVARASLFNFALITVTGLVLIWSHFGSIGPKGFVLALAIGICLSGASGLAFWKLSQSHDRLMRIVGDSDAGDRTAA